MAMKLNMLPPSVNNMSVRVFVRAAGSPSRRRTSGARRRRRVPFEVPARADADDRERRVREGVLGRELRRDDVFSTTHGRDDLYPSDPKKRAMVDARTSTR
jgi:glutathione S-transferase